MTLEEMARLAREIGFDGLNYCLRPGYPVTPTNVRTDLQKAVKMFADAGQPIRMVTTDVTDPSDPNLESILAGLSQSGIALMRLGYWRYDPALGYFKCLQNVRKAVDGIVKICSKHNVRAVVQMHGGGNMVENSQSAIRVVEGFDPRYLGVWSDPGNMLSSSGTEDWSIHYDLINDYLAVLGAFNMKWLVQPNEKQPKRRMVPIKDGIIDYAGIFSMLKKRGFHDITISAHTEYDRPRAEIVKIAKKDIQYIRRTWEQS